MLAKQIAQHGETVTLTRSTGTEPAAHLDAELRAIVRGYDPADLTSGIRQGESRVILDPADLERLQWPAALPGAKAADRLPRKGDKVTIGGRQRALTRNAEPVRIGDTIVRLNLDVEG
jgi:hypothetical protein